jgi:hypothetical protein
MKILKAVALVVLLAAVPWAMYYNLNFDRYGVIDRPAPPVFIQIVTLDAGVFNNTLKARAADYASRNHGVRIFVLPMSAEQVSLYDFNIRIIRDGGVNYAFISPTQTKEALEHCKKFLEGFDGTKIYVM